MATTFQEVVDSLRWKKTAVLNDGFVCLVDCMGDEGAVVQAARVSYGEGTKHISDDRTLLRYLMRHRHTTPLEMVEVKFLVRVPMDCWRQWIRHRTASVNEYSTRYSEAIDSMQTTNPDEWRSQSTSNKQGSGNFLDQSTKFVDGLTDLTGNIVRFRGDKDDPEGYESVGQFLSTQEQTFQQIATKLYQDRLAVGVAKEQARKDLPLATFTEAYWKIDLHNLLHFLSLRMDSHAQLEIRLFANAIGEIVQQLWPTIWEAFLDYRLSAITLTGTEIEMIKTDASRESIERHLPNKREREEFYAKLAKLGFLS